MIPQIRNAAIKIYNYQKVVIVIIISLVVACSEDTKAMPDDAIKENEMPVDSTGSDANDMTITTIMPLGASRVQGARLNFESYRYESWKLMIDAEWAFDYIVTVDDEAAYPD